MSCRRTHMAVLLCALAFSSPAALAQAPTPAPPAPAAPPGALKVPVPAEQSDIGPPVYTYEVGGRRDPFKSLLIRDTNVPRDRPPGLPGMLVEELELQGTIKTAQGWVAMMRGSDNKSYLLRKGTTVFDGEVTDINASDVTFRQNVTDPTNPKPFRDVTKSLMLARPR